MVYRALIVVVESLFLILKASQGDMILMAGDVVSLACSGCKHL